jgi:glycosyltransferase involved in cell wall biosynthesis
LSPTVAAKRILYISSVPTHPVIAGNRARVRRLAEDLRALGHELHVLFIRDVPADLDAMRAWLDGRFHVVDNRRRPRRNPLRFRALDVVTAGRGLGPRFEYLADVDQLVSESLDREVARLAAQLRPDVVVVTYAFYSRLLCHFRAPTLKILDTVDRISHRHWQRHRGGTRFLSTSLRQERRALGRADLVLAIQDEERAHFARLTSIPVVTLGHRSTLQRLPLPAAGDPPRLGFAASANDRNAQAIRWFASRVLPRLRARHPDLELLLAGPICDRPGLRLGPGVRRLGVVDDLAKLYEQVHVVVNPSLSGTGLHIKNVEAMGYGRPLVMTPMAARGIRAGAGNAYLLAPSARRFARAISSLLDDRARAERLADGAYRFVTAYDARVLATLRTVLAAR